MTNERYYIRYIFLVESIRKRGINGGGDYLSQTGELIATTAAAEASATAAVAVVTATRG